MKKSLVYIIKMIEWSQRSIQFTQTKLRNEDLSYPESVSSRDSIFLGYGPYYYLDCFENCIKLFYYYSRYADQKMLIYLPFVCLTQGFESDSLASGNRQTTGCSLSLTVSAQRNEFDIHLSLQWRAGR